MPTPRQTVLTASQGGSIEQPLPDWVAGFKSTVASLAASTRDPNAPLEIAEITCRKQWAEKRLQVEAEYRKLFGEPIDE